MLRSYRDPNHHDIIIHRFSDRATIDDICDVFVREERSAYLPLKAIWDYRNATVDFPFGVHNTDVFRNFTERLKTLRLGSVAALVCAHELQARLLQNVVSQLMINSEMRVFTNWNEAYRWLTDHD